MLNSITGLLSAVNMDNLKIAGDVFWKGCVAILIVITAIALVTFLLNYAFNKYADRKKAKQQQNNPTNDDKINPSNPDQ